MEDEQQLDGQDPHQHRGGHDDGTTAGGTTDAQPRPGQPAQLVQPVQPAPPAHLAHLDAEPELAAARELLTTSRQAEAKTLIAILSYQDRRAREAETAGLGHHARRAHHDAATRDAARILGVTDPTASGILRAARTARTTLPATWKAFLTGIIDTPQAARHHHHQPDPHPPRLRGPARSGRCGCSSTDDPERATILAAPIHRTAGLCPVRAGLPHRPGRSVGADPA